LKGYHALSTLLQGVVVKRLIGDQTAQVKAISFDSRVVRGATLFVAIKGTRADGHDHIQEAVAAGSTVIVCEHVSETPSERVTYVIVPDSEQALGMIAANFYDRPATRLRLVAVTGTNGKTSTVHLLAGLFNRLGYRVGMLSTICNKINVRVWPTSLTTPDAIQLNIWLARMVEQGCQYCFMEASSHAIVQKRIAGLQFAGAVFLNITHDHLDYHKTFDAYIQAKKKLFDDLSADAFALFNIDDKHGSVMVQNTKAASYSFSLKDSAGFTAKILANTLQGLELRIAHQTAWFRLVGTFNAYNILAAYATACLLGVDGHDALTALSALLPVPGRFQHIHTQAGFDVVIDYAHTPDALRNVLKAIVQIKNKSGNVITVIGCGGDRDKKKRPIMAQVALKFSNRVVLTSDNPRSEAPEDIIRDMQAGMTPVQRQKTFSIVDRVEAIQSACQLAQSKDIILIAGKGHEIYQEIKGIRYPFDDNEVLQNVLRYM
jgi:UDP-N-acetylmuramoyl-L-alanyl-D-glutamate--2,6-diaminopimelate ligase